MQLTIRTTMLFAAAITFASAASAGAAKVTVTGTVGDAMCGVTHMVKGDDAACTRNCAKGGAEYALLVKDKAYTLKADARTKAVLDQYANRLVTVSGDRSGDTIAVASVQPAK
jgi:hypothetical protein